MILKYSIVPKESEAEIKRDEPPGHVCECALEAGNFLENFP